MIKIYDLLIENQKFYIGQTKDVESRYIMHEKGKESSDWTRLHKPIRIIEIRETSFSKMEDAIMAENKVTFEYMHKYGWNNVKGGDFYKADERNHKNKILNYTDIFK